MREHPFAAWLLPVLIAGLGSVALAQTPKLEPLPEPPPLPPAAATDPAAPPIRVGPGPDDKVEEVTIDGQRGLKVTTPGGNVYYLVPDPAGRVGTQGPTPDVRVPQWVIKEF